MAKVGGEVACDGDETVDGLHCDGGGNGVDGVTASGSEGERERNGDGVSVCQWILSLP